MRRSTCLGLLLALLGFGAASAAPGKTCSLEDFDAAVDRSGSALRTFNAAALPKLKDKLKQLKERSGRDEPGFEERVLARIRDQRMAKLDAEAEDLILKIDTLGRPPAGKPLDCAKLTELDAAGLELLAVMKAKSAYTLTKLDATIAGKDKRAAPDKERKIARTSPPPAKAGPPKPDRKSSAEAWDARTETRPEPPVVTAPLPLPEAEAGYTIDEIQEITRGFFGTISTSLASVLEHAFSTSGRPDAYVLGQEGGGAFLAGVRYGSGTLYLRAGGTRKVYWHGPSIGTDFGAAGSRTMFLIYNLREPGQLFRGFTGIDGSAYFVGGVGLTFLKGGDVLMAPIRSGLGFRLGANLGYIRFTPRQTWNPF